MWCSLFDFFFDNLDRALGGEYWGCPKNRGFGENLISYVLRSNISQNIINSYNKTIIAWLIPARICKDFSSQEEKASYLLRKHLKHNIDSFVRIFMAQCWCQSAREWGKFLILFSFLEAEILRHGPTPSFSPTDFIDTVVHIYS